MRAHLEDDNGEHYYREDPNAEDKAYDQMRQEQMDREFMSKYPKETGQSPTAERF